jgi:MFS transporter, ACS family, glucarate transporter
MSKLLTDSEYLLEKIDENIVMKENNMKTTFIPIRYVLVLFTFIHTLNLYIDRACISAAKDSIVADLNLSLTQWGWIMAVFTLGYALFQTPTGYIIDSRGPRFVLTFRVIVWSCLTTLTGFMKSFFSMLVVRFFFGAGEAGAFPALSKVVYNWYPVNERGIVQGINSSGARIGAALALPFVAFLIDHIGWRYSFVFFGVTGIIYAILWYIMFRDKPENYRYIGGKEKDYILKNRQLPSGKKVDLPFGCILRSRNMWLAMGQYIASNFTFYFTLSWMYPYLKERFALGGIEAGFYSSVPLLAGALGNWASGFLVDNLYKTRGLTISRRLPAIIGFVLAAIGILAMLFAASPQMSVIFLSVAIFGVDMTLSPSWSFCIDIAGDNTGAVSGTMNMAGNLGAFITIVAFPYLLTWTGNHQVFFYVCSALSLAALVIWFFMKPDKPIMNYS